MYRTMTQKALLTREITLDDIRAIQANHPRLYAVAMCRSFMGKGSSKHWTLEEIAMNFGVSIGKVRQLEAKAIAFIKRRKGH